MTLAASALKISNQVNKSKVYHSANTNSIRCVSKRGTMLVFQVKGQLGSIVNYLSDTRTALNAEEDLAVQVRGAKH